MSQFPPSTPQPEATVVVAAVNTNTAAMVLGILGAVLGGTTLLFGWIPFVGCIVLPVAAVALILSVIGLIVSSVRSALWAVTGFWDSACAANSLASFSFRAARTSGWSKPTTS